MNFRTHIKETIKLAVPISLGQLGHVMMGVVDSLMVGKVSYTSLAAASLVNGLFFLVLVVGIGMTYASTPLIAIAKGSNNQHDCGKILNHSLIVNVTFSVILMLGTFSLSFLIPHMNQSKEVVREAIPYLQILTLSVIPFMVFQCYRQFLEGLSIPNPPMIIAISANLLNAFLNWIFIYGKFGLPAMGLFGAGIATTATRWVMAAVLMIFTLKYLRVKIYEPRFKIKPVDKNLIKKLINIGLPSGFQYLLEVGAFAFGAIMIGWIGAKQLAAHQIAISLASATYMVILGIASAGTIRVGDAVGKKSIEQIRSAGFSAIALASAVMLTFALIFFLFRNILPTFYNTNPEVIEIASALLIVAGFFQLFDGLQATGIGILRGLTDVKIPLLISILSYWVIAIPICYLLGFVFNFGAPGIWVGLLLGLASLGI